MSGLIDEGMKSRLMGLTSSLASIDRDLISERAGVINTIDDVRSHSPWIDEALSDLKEASEMTALMQTVHDNDDALNRYGLYRW
jgi:hypothetical protein